MPELETGAAIPFHLVGLYEIIVYEVTIGGVNYYVAARGSTMGVFSLIDDDTVPGVVINAALAEADLTGLGEVTVCGATYPLEISVTFPANELILTGRGRTTLLDGDGLPTGQHAIVINGRTDCIVRYLAIQTQDGGGKNCHCVYIANGADRFSLEFISFVDSDSDAIRIGGTNINGGEILACKVLDADDYAIYANMDPLSLLTDLKIELCRLTCSSQDAIFLRLVIESDILGNFIHDVVPPHRGIFIIGEDVTALSRVTIVSNEIVNAYYGIQASMVGVFISTEWLIGSNEIYDSVENAIVVDAGQRGVVCDNFISNTGSSGIVLSNACIDIHLHGNYLLNIGMSTPGAGIFFAATWPHVRCSIHGNFICGTVNNYGIWLQNGCIDFQINDNHIYSATVDCIRVEGGGPGLEVYNTLIQGNYLNAGTGYCINLLNAWVIDTKVGYNHMTGGVGLINDLGTNTHLPEITVVVSDPDGNIGTHPAIVLTDGVDVTARFEIKIPSQLQELVRARIILVPGGDGNLRRSVSTNWGKICEDDYNGNTDSIAAGEIAVTLNVLECIDMSAAFTGVGASDIVGLEFTRHGSHANDTVNADCYLLAFNLQYV